MRWKLIIEYKGTGYAGWQRQRDGIATVQQAVEEAIRGFCQQDVTLHVAGRTDAGVHARGQVAHCDLDPGGRALSGHDLAKAVNAHLRPHPVSIVKAVAVDDRFHARHGALNKLYTYRIINRSAPLTFDRDLAWFFKRPLDVAAMQEAAPVLLGHHDFTTFRDSQCQAKSPLRTLDRLEIESRHYDQGGGTEILFHTEAKSFLHHQVRNIVGSLVMVGEGKWNRQDLKAALEARDRTKGGPTAPAAGLTMVRVDYES